MTTYYESFNKEYNKASRYQILRVINDGYNRYLETQNPQIIKESDDDVYHIVASTEANRLDIIAAKYYGDASYWWLIALANNLIDPFIVNQGTMLRIPSIMSLAGFDNEILYRQRSPFYE